MSPFMYPLLKDISDEGCRQPFIYHIFLVTQNVIAVVLGPKYNSAEETTISRILAVPNV